MNGSKNTDMTREIKFRIWNTKEKYIEDLSRPWAVLDNKVWDLRNGNELRDVKLLEFTNFEDNNGKDIFEGDIIRRYTYDGDIEWGYVVYCTCLGGFDLNMVLTTEEFDQFQIVECPTEAFEDCEVIGNIYENPEILDLELDEWDRLNGKNI